MCVPFLVVGVVGGGGGGEVSGSLASKEEGIEGGEEEEGDGWKKENEGGKAAPAIYGASLWRGLRKISSMKRKGMEAGIYVGVSYRAWRPGISSLAL